MNKKGTLLSCFQNELERVKKMFFSYRNIVKMCMLLKTLPLNKNMYIWFVSGTRFVVVKFCTYFKKKKNLTAFLLGNRNFFPSCIVLHIVEG